MSEKEFKKKTEGERNGVLKSNSEEETGEKRWYS